MTERTWPLHLYRFATTALSPLLGGLLVYRTYHGKEDLSRRGERRGIPGCKRPLGPLAWLHGASVGETVSLLPIIERLTRQGFNVLVTSGTVTSARLLAARLPGRAFHQYIPFDVPGYMQRFMDYWQPELVLIAESEIWPNALMEIKKRGIPILLLNARMSERSFRRWQKLPLTASTVLKHFDLCLAQSIADGERLERLGASRVVVAGNIKYDVPAPPANPATVATFSAVIGERPVWISTSTHPGEDEFILQVHRLLAPLHPGLLTIIAPRHPERGEDVAMLAEAYGQTTELRSNGALPERDLSVYVADTIGELGLFYRLAPIAFIGGSLVPHGGQNPIEAAKLGAAIIHGPYVKNFADVYHTLDASQAAWPVSDVETLANAVHTLLSHPIQARAMARAATERVNTLGGAVDATMQAINPYILHMHLNAR